jgi:hypothetical protein
MLSPRICLTCLAALACAVPAVAQSPRPAPEPTPQFRTKTATSASAARMVPLDSLPSALREKVRKTITQPTLVTHAPTEEFQAAPAMYEWLMEHPDRAAAAWQRLGVNCQPINDRGQGRFGWSDEHGSDLTWSIIARSPQCRVWYAEGQVKASPRAPMVPVRSVIVMRYNLPATPTGKITHEIDAFCWADSRMASLAYRMFGQTADRMAGEAAEQLLVFFSSISKYVAEHPDQTERLLAPPQSARGTSR